MEDAKRVRAALTARIEKRALEAMARRMPKAVNSDHLTALGVVAALGVGAGYALSRYSPHWLWLSSVMLALNWFGDSLDGTVARDRKSERHRYGYYLDHAVDAFTTAVIGGGIGLSPFISFEVALLLVIVYLMLSINVYLESKVYGVFRMDYGIVGPTEARILLILLNTLLVWALVATDVRPAAIEPLASLAVGILVGVMALLLLWRFTGNVRDLYRLEPLDRGEPATMPAPGAGPASRDP
jgi:archaetidylinositol phosphate synthase